MDNDETNPGPVEPISEGLPDPDLEKLLDEEEQIAGQTMKQVVEERFGGWLPASSENQSSHHHSSTEEMMRAYAEHDVAVTQKFFEVEREDGNLVAHARRELELMGEEPDVIEWYLTVVRAFASFGHSGGSVMATLPVLYELLQFHNLTELTDDPDEWMDVTEYTSETGGMWQNKRCSEAFSDDGGKTYWLLSEGCNSEYHPTMHDSKLHNPPPKDDPELNRILANDPDGRHLEIGNA